MLNDWQAGTHTRNNRLFQFMSIMDKIWRRFAFYPICRGNPTTNQTTTDLCCRCVSYNVCLPLSFFRDILPSPKQTQQQHTPYNLIQLFRSTLRPANAMWSLIKLQKQYLSAAVKKFDVSLTLMPLPARLAQTSAESDLFWLTIAEIGVGSFSERAVTLP